jgi:hypothetical protein
VGSDELPRGVERALAPAIAHPTLTRFQSVLDGTGRRIVSVNSTDKSVFIGFDVHNAPTIGSACADRAEKKFINAICTALSDCGRSVHKMKDPIKPARKALKN